MSLTSPHHFNGAGPVPNEIRAAAERIAALRVKFINQWTPGMENPLTTREIEELFHACALQAEWMRELLEARDAANEDAANGWRWAEDFVNYDHMLPDTEKRWRQDANAHHAKEAQP